MENIPASFVEHTKKRGDKTNNISKSNSNTSNKSHNKDEHENTNSTNEMSEESESNNSCDEEDEKLQEKTASQSKLWEMIQSVDYDLRKKSRRKRVF
jgi:hypothetical protein